MYKKLAVFGCSFTKDNWHKTWADILAKELNLHLINRAERGASSEFVVTRILTSIDLDPADTVIAVMWPTSDRVMFRIDESVPYRQKDLKHATWVDGQSPGLVDYDGSYSKNTGFCLMGSHPRGYSQYYWKYLYNPTQLTNRYYIDIVLIQRYLESRGFRYIMLTSLPLKSPADLHLEPFEVVDTIYNQINLEKFEPDAENLGFLNYCIKENLPFDDRIHPKEQSHQIYTEQIIKPKILEIL